MAMKWLLFASIVLTAQVQAQAHPAFIGCYAVAVASVAGDDYVNAKGIRLTSLAAMLPWGSKGGLQVVPALSTERFEYAGAYWERANRQVTITFSNTGLSGLRMYLRPTHAGFEGTIENFWDFMQSTDRHKVVLARRSCER